MRREGVCEGVRGGEEVRVRRGEKERGEIVIW